MIRLQVLVERFCFEIGNRPGGGTIVVEKRDPTWTTSFSSRG